MKSHGNQLRFKTHTCYEIEMVLCRFMTFLLQRSTIAVFAVVISVACESLPAVASSHFVSNIAQLKGLSNADFLDGCDFDLTGVVTLIDTNRQLVVLQDTGGAVALNIISDFSKLDAGQLVRIIGTNCSPYFSHFPDYPYRPSGRDILPRFETPSNRGEYYLTRMRGWLHPPVTGRYTFWIASDNSSELWLSLDANPALMRRIAGIPTFSYVEPREWSRFPSQRSESIELKAGEVYYLEALQEQTVGSDNLSVAWQGPTIDQSVIDGAYLTPWNEGYSAMTNAGIFREYWTNFTLGRLIGMGGPRTFESALTVKDATITVVGSGRMPEPVPVVLGQPWRTDNNFRWITVDGMVNFCGEDQGTALLEISDGQALAQVRVLHWNADLARRITNALVRVEGVGEGAYDQRGLMLSEIIWVSTSNAISVVQTRYNSNTVNELGQITPPVITNTPAMEGYFATRGVVTFNDRVLGKDYSYVQEGGAALRVAMEGGRFKNQFKLGQWMDIGGALEPGKNIGTITPMAVMEMGWHSMPTPLDQPISRPVSGTRDGRWTEIQGVVHSQNSDGTLTLFGKNGAVHLWIGNSPSNHLTRYVDAKVRARGVLSLDNPDWPLLLIPSQAFVSVEEQPPQDAFAMPECSVADVLSRDVDLGRTHRVRVKGEVTWRDAQAFFVQDTSGGIEVRSVNGFGIEVGQRVEVIAFPVPGVSWRSLDDAVVRAAEAGKQLKPQELELTKGLLAGQGGLLVTVKATLLSRKTNGGVQSLELHQQGRGFVANLALERGRVPEIAAGSSVRLIGVWNNENAGVTPSIRLRSPGDVVVLSGPPWWTWQKTVVLIGALIGIAAGALSWAYWLRRRFERQQAAQLAFSRHVLVCVEEERKRIAANLHDSLGQVLLAIKNHALLAMQSNPTEKNVQDRLKEISLTSSQAIHEVRQIIHGLRPYQLDRLGLTQAIRALISRGSENSTILFASRVEDLDGLFDKEAEIHVYRIIQEAVNNIVKHSCATEATVVIKKRENVIMLSIRDNGRGYDAEKWSPDSHDVGYGLSGMAERVRILGGTMTINSQPEHGTSLNIDIPQK